MYLGIRLYNLGFHSNSDLFISDINETFLEDLEVGYLSRGKKIKSGKGLAFPIMRDVIDGENNERIYYMYQNRLCNHNRRLITIGKALGLNENLTTYVAHHTFATAGLHKGVSKAQIGDMLGHTNYYTTEAYFDDFDKAVLDEAADQILG